MASEKIFRSAVFGGFNRSDVISYIEDLRNEISDLQRKYADKETKINELEDKVGDLTEKCASLNDLQEKYNVQCDTVEALKNENSLLSFEIKNDQNQNQLLSDLMKIGNNNFWHFYPRNPGVSSLVWGLKSWTLLIFWPKTKTESNKKVNFRNFISRR
mgnify:CR=1 FL=1